ncbi:hypothetical protein BP5796_06076 [Coleophoma crateriformis]|uniref:Uncharacterized protein n=1 Tax=Coleophoma crateriformis TaxID=565419 RepID=A0A3D8RWL0_9HELO|nr:hypothetical protein BP5796_06076 [Coleophoma crateriformis]
MQIIIDASVLSEGGTVCRGRQPAGMMFKPRYVTGGMNEPIWAKGERQKQAWAGGIVAGFGDRRGGARSVLRHQSIITITIGLLEIRGRQGTGQ